MELKVTKEAVTINEAIFDSTVEQSIECDLVLPDYCPDIARIFKCAVDPDATRYTQNADKLVIDGTAFIRVFYLNDQNTVSCAETKTAFSKTVDLKSVPENPVIHITGKVGYINCRAVNQRRIDIRGSIALGVNVVSQRTDQVITDLQGGNVQLNRHMVDMTDIVACASRTLESREEIEIDPGQPEVEQVLRFEVCANLTDCKVITNKLLLRGELQVKVVYLCDSEGNIALVEYALPLSHVIDMEGVNEDHECFACLTPTQVMVTPKASVDEECRTLVVDYILQCNAIAHSPKQICVIGDVYSTAYECALEKRPMVFERLYKIVDEKITQQEVMEFGDASVSEVLDIWARPSIKSVKTQDDCIVVSGTSQVCVLYKDSEGTPSFMEKTFDFEYKYPIEGNLSSVRMQAYLSQCSISYTLSEQKLEFRSEMNLKGVIYVTCRENIVCECTVNEDAPQAKDPRVALTIYYADAGENVWDIAKRYHTSVSAVMEENDLEQETIAQRGMLLIPIVNL